MDKRPHIIIFNVDQWRGDVLGHVGNPAAETPNLDKIVKRNFRLSTFIDDTINKIARTYALFMRQGIKIIVNGTPVQPG